MNQATLSIKNGSLGVGKAADSNIPAYFLSLKSSRSVGSVLLPNNEELGTRSNSGGISWSKLGEPYNSETDHQIWHDCVF